MHDYVDALQRLSAAKAAKAALMRHMNARPSTACAAAITLTVADIEAANRDMRRALSKAMSLDIATKAKAVAS